MPAPQEFDERTVEAFLARRSTAAADVGALAAFAEDLQVVVSGPPPAASPPLARLLTEGFSIDELPAPAPSGPAPVASPTQRSRGMIRQTLGNRVARVAGLGLVAKLALGVGVAAASVTTAGAANVLPDPAQDAVAAVVNAATPLHMDDSHPGRGHHKTTKAGTDGARADDPAGDMTDLEVDDDGTDGEGKPTDNHGACVSAIAKAAPTGQGSEHGKVVSEAAKSCPKGHGPEETPSPTTSSTVAGTNVGETGEDEGPGQAGQPHGQAGQTHGRAGDHGQGADQGQAGQPHGQAGDPHGRDGQDHGPPAESHE